MQVNKPIPGYYKRRMVRGGPWVPVLIENPKDPLTGEEMDRGHTERLVAYVNGLPAELYETWTSCCGNPISKDEYDRLKPSADPLKPLEWKNGPTVF